MSWPVAFHFTLDYEGWYSNTPGDRGGETVRGISRVKHPEWPGWPVFDQLKVDLGSPCAAARSHVIAGMVTAFYRVEFWEKAHCDELPWKMGMAVFDFAVNSGPERAIRIMQVALGVQVDGIVGPQTVKAAHDRGEEAVVDLLARRAKFLHEIMDNDPTQKMWCMNWFRRLFKLANVVLEG